jgi:DNA polymerase III sliding clamp (beta) subunit (PCNA family)
MKYMSCTIDAGEFRHMLDKALKAAAKRSRIPVLDEALVRFNGDTCAITCTNLELWCQASTPSDAKPCAFVLTNSRKLLTACKYFSGDMLLSYTEDDPPKSFPTRTNLDGSLVMICGDKELRQRVTAAEDFPEMPEVKAEQGYDIDPDVLSKRFERIKYALSSNTNRPSYRCVKFFDDRIGAVDGYRMAVSRDKSLRVEKPFLIPPAAMKLLPLFEGVESRLSVGEKYVVIDSGCTRVIVRMPEGDSLDFDAAIPDTFKEEHPVDITDFMDDLRYLSEFIQFPSREYVRFQDGVLSVETAKGSYSSKLKLAEIPATVCGFNGGYMMDALKQFQAKKLATVTMRMSSAVSPIIMSDGEDLALVLPMRLKDRFKAA